MSRADEHPGEPEGNGTLEAVELSDIESIITSGTNTRGELLAPYARGGLADAAALVAAGRRVAIVTGFSVPTADGFAPETDGPPGAATLAAFLGGCGVRSRVITDDRNLAVCKAAMSAYADLPLSAEFAPDVVAVADSEPLDREVVRSIDADVLIFIERLGPNLDGKYLSMRGTDLTHVTPRLDQLIAPGVSTIGIGDGGNEIGMGRLPGEAVEQLSNGSTIRCVVGTDALIVAGVSNWGAAALVAALGKWDRVHMDLAVEALSPERFERCLEDLTIEGAVDGFTGTIGLSVDGMECAIHKQVLVALGCAAESA